MQALKRANEVRFEMAEAKKLIGEGKVPQGQLFDPERFGNLTVGEVLTAQHRWGKTRMRKFLNQWGLEHYRSMENVKVGDLTLRERRSLTAAIDPDAPRLGDRPSNTPTEED